MKTDKVDMRDWDEPGVSLILIEEPIGILWGFKRLRWRLHLRRHLIRCPNCARLFDDRETAEPLKAVGCTTYCVVCWGQMVRALEAAAKLAHAVDMTAASLAMIRGFQVILMKAFKEA